MLLFYSLLVKYYFISSRKGDLGCNRRGLLRWGEVGILQNRTPASQKHTSWLLSETVLGEQIMSGKDKVGIISDLDPNKPWRIKDVSELKTFLKYLQSFSKIPVKLTKKLEGDLEGKIANWKENDPKHPLQVSPGGCTWAPSP